MNNFKHLLENILEEKTQKVVVLYKTIISHNMEYSEIFGVFDNKTAKKYKKHVFLSQDAANVDISEDGKLYVKTKTIKTHSTPVGQLQSFETGQYDEFIVSNKPNGGTEVVLNKPIITLAKIKSL